MKARCCGVEYGGNGRNQQVVVQQWSQQQQKEEKDVQHQQHQQNMKKHFFLILCYSCQCTEWNWRYLKCLQWVVDCSCVDNCAADTKSGKGMKEHRMSSRLSAQQSSSLCRSPNNPSIYTFILIFFHPHVFCFFAFSVPKGQGECILYREQLQVRQSGNLISAGAAYISPKLEGRIWGSYGLLFNWYCDSLPEGKAAGSCCPIAPSTTEAKSKWSYTTSFHIYLLCVRRYIFTFVSFSDLC